MEPINQILRDSNPLNSGKTVDSSKSLDAWEARQKAILKLIIRLYASARKELPADESLEIEVRLAMDDLREIPDHDLAHAFREAQVLAGGFVPTNGLIVRCWRDGRAKNFDEAQKAIRLENNRRYLLADGADLPTPEERESIARGMASIGKKLREDG